MDAYQQFINDRCLEIIDELNSSSIFVSFEQTILILLDRFEAPSLNSLLNFSDNESLVIVTKSVLILQWLYDINIKIYNFISCYLSTHCIISIKDIDEQLTKILHAFQFQTFNEIIIKLQNGNDPNMIDIDSQNTLFPCVNDASFSNFGVGNLILHPLLRDYFSEIHRDTPVLNQKIFISEMCIINWIYEDKELLNDPKIFDNKNCDVLQHLFKDKFRAMGYLSSQSAGICFQNKASLWCELLMTLMRIQKSANRKAQVGAHFQEGKDNNKNKTDSETGITYLPNSFENNDNNINHKEIHGISFDGKMKWIFKDNCTSSYLQTITNSELLGCFPWNRGGKLDSHSTGRWGEALVFHYLRKIMPFCKVYWLNEKEETKAPYDIKVESPGANSKLVVTTFIEVKSTRSHENNVFDISLSEWQFATSLPKVNYHVYRVLNVGNESSVYIIKMIDILNCIDNGMAKLCLAINI